MLISEVVDDSASAEPPELAFEADAIAAQLAEGKEPSTFGITLSLGLPPPEPWRGNYQLFAAELKAAFSRLAPEDRECAYIYPAPCLHITVATLVSFFNGLPEAQTPGGQSAAREAWQSAVSEALKGSGGALSDGKSFRLRVQRPTLGKKAAIFRFDDVDGAVGRMRDALNAARARSRGAWPKWLDDAGYNVPGIVHSTFLRFVRPPAHPAAFRAAFEGVAARWSVIDVKFRCVQAGIEAVPYLHLKERRVDSHDVLIRVNLE